jgi:hypothetical protein
VKKRPPSEIECVLADRPKPSPAMLPSPRLAGLYSADQQAKIAGALGWKTGDPRLPGVILDLEAATAYLPLDRSGPQGKILREIGKLGTRMVALLGKLSVENQRGIGAMEAERVVSALKNRALAVAPRRGPPKTRHKLRPFIECAADIWQKTKGQSPSCSCSRGVYRGQFLKFVAAAVHPFVKIAAVGFAETVGTTLAAIRRNRAQDKSTETTKLN